MYIDILSPFPPFHTHHHTTSTPNTHLSLHVGGNPCIQQLLHNVIVSLGSGQVQCPCVVLHTHVDLAASCNELMNYAGVAVPDSEMEGSPTVLRKRGLREGGGGAREGRGGQGGGQGRRRYTKM